MFYRILQTKEPIDKLLAFEKEKCAENNFNEMDKKFH